MPRPDELNDAPELALLAAIRAALDVLVYAVVSANPELVCQQFPADAHVRAAKRILVDADHLGRAIDAYRRALAALSPAPSPDSDDLPF
jgi:hypothetical protein